MTHLIPRHCLSIVRRAEATAGATHSAFSSGRDAALWTLSIAVGIGLAAVLLANSSVAWAEELQAAAPLSSQESESVNAGLLRFLLVGGASHYTAAAQQRLCLSRSRQDGAQLLGGNCWPGV